MLGDYYPKNGISHGVQKFQVLFSRLFNRYGQDFLLFVGGYFSVLRKINMSKGLPFKIPTVNRRCVIKRNPPNDVKRNLRINDLFFENVETRATEIEKVSQRGGQYIREMVFLCLVLVCTCSFIVIEFSFY